MSLGECVNGDASASFAEKNASILDAIIRAASNASRDFRSFRRFAGLVAQVYGSSYGDYLSPAERAEYGDLHIEAEAVVGLYLDAAANAGRRDEADLWRKWAQEAGEVAASLMALAVKMKRGVHEEGLRRCRMLVAMARDAGLSEDEVRAVGCAFDDGGEADAFEVLCSCLFADGVTLTRGQAALLASMGERIGADPHLWRMVDIVPTEKP